MRANSDKHGKEQLSNDGYEQQSGNGPQRRGFLKGALGLGVGSVVAGCFDDGELDDGDGFSVTFTQGAEPETLDPHNHSTGSVADVVQGCYDLVIQSHPFTGELAPGLATDWEFVDDTTGRVYIREGVSFHNGDTLTPEDVAFSINRIVDDDVGDLVSPRRDTLDSVVGAETVDGEYAVDLVLDYEDPLLFMRLSNASEVMSKDWFSERDQEEIATEMMGTGPFRLDEYDLSSEIVLTRYEDHWRDEPDDYISGSAPSMDELTWNWAEEDSTRVSRLQAGETDLVRNVPPDLAQTLEGDSNTDYVSTPTDRPMFMVMRYDVEPFDNKEFRQALNYAVDVETIIDTILDGFGDPAAQVTPDFWFGHHPDLDPYPYDYDRAVELVEESGVNDVEFEIMTPTGRWLQDVEVVEAIAGYFSELPGVEATANAVEYATWSDAVTSGSIEDMPEAFYLGYGAGPEDGTIKYNALMSCDALGIFSAYCNEELDDLVQSSLETTDEDERLEYLHDAAELAKEEAPLVLLHWQHSIMGHNDRITYDIPPTEQMWYGLVGEN